VIDVAVDPRHGPEVRLDLTDTLGTLAVGHMRSQRVDQRPRPWRSHHSLGVMAGALRPDARHVGGVIAASYP
jgi:hypothetical protein